MDKLKQLMSDIDELIKVSADKEKEMLAEADTKYSELACEIARQIGYQEVKNLIYKYL